jgi:hypothetical protein
MREKNNTHKVPSKENAHNLYGLLLLITKIGNANAIIIQ